MPEPTLATIATTTAVAGAAAATALIPGIDGNALVGALAGGALFVTMAKDLPLWRRAVYLGVSAGGGYVAAPDVLAHLPLQSIGLAAFLGGATIITLATQVIERAKNFDFSPFSPKSGA